MASGDGNGWVTCRCGHQHWGRFGAAGLVLLRAEPGREPEVLLQLRAGWTHEGGTWGVTGGARDSHEDAATAALRESAEEAGVDAADVKVLGEHVGTDHGDWAYTYVLALATGTVEPEVRTGLFGGLVRAESEELRWVPLSSVESLPLHPGLRAAWPDLGRRIAALDLGDAA